MPPAVHHALRERAAAPICRLAAADGSACGAICPGEVIAIEGVNLSGELRENRVLFRAGDVSIEGAPTEVTFPSDGDPGNGLESSLRVLVPGGVVTGEIEVEVRGLQAGVLGFEACPMLLAVAIGPSDREPHLVHWSGGTFQPCYLLPPNTMVLFGVNFDELTEAWLSDRVGIPHPVPRREFIRRQVPGLPPHNLQVVEFRGDCMNMVLSELRDNLTIQVRAGPSISNRMQAPTRAFLLEAEGVGAVLNGVLVPSGVVTGPVRIRYSIYDHPKIDQTFAMDVQWTPDGGKTYFRAKPDLTDPEHDGVSGIIPDLLGPGPLPGPLPVGGALRTFTWDAPNDPRLREVLPREGLGIRFRLHPIPEGTVFGKPGDTRHFIESPPIAYRDPAE